MHGTLKGGRLRVRGTVQGVGFRPWVWQLARASRLHGCVLNDAEGVLIEAWGEAGAFDRFLRALHGPPPPLARIEAIEWTPAPPPRRLPPDFTIAHSRAGETRTGVAADTATCSDCLAEVFDESDRRHHYPFTNCTHCGPRFSIVRRVPYDRANTSMALFALCGRCRREYENPADRRFHAQPNACPACGPRIWLEARGEGRLEGDSTAVVEQAVRLIRAGWAVAIKGIGGIHLACDATSETAVAALRRRKRRHHKAFALMARDLEMVARYARLDERSARLLAGPAAPIVILEPGAEPLASAVNPGQRTLGFMLPYTPLHHLLMARLDAPMVLTSGNISDEPQCIANDEARRKLAGVADAFLLHDREIVTRLDDSVVQVAAGGPRMLRRARGYAPEPLELAEGVAAGARVLAMGAELKSTFCLLEEGRAILSQHLGDLENAATFREYRRLLEHYQRLFDFEPDLVVVDGHPDYLSTQLGRQLAEARGLPLLRVQHHHAHMAACMAEHGLPADAPPVMGLILDGLGHGGDGTFWGGEFLLGGYGAFRRVASFAPVAMPGGAMAMREPWRNTWAHIAAALGWEQAKRRFSRLELMAFLEQKPLNNLERMVRRGLNSPVASSAGRLFDAVAAALYICREQADFEGQAAMALEALALEAPEAEPVYPVLLERNRIHWKALWEGLLTDLESDTEPALVAARFHASLSRGLARIALELCRQHHVETLVLGGGVFQNRLLLEGLAAALRNSGIRLLIPGRVPANDGGISLGQAVVGGFHDGAR
jgi:hydrogenase maturation protein HypF